MAKAGPGVRGRVWRKVVVALMVGIAAAGALVYWQRYRLAVRYMQGNKTVQKMVILQMLDMARPIIERDLKMTLPEKIFSAMAGKRNQKERQAGALEDVRTFGELSFANHWLKFKDVHGLSSLDGFDLKGFSFALEWNRGNTAEVLAAFNINLLKREVGKAQVNQQCSFFSDLKLYVEKRARKD